MSTGAAGEALWPRAIMLMDLNAFFASIEQLDFPELRGRPVAVTNGAVGSCIITCSYEARRLGIKTGMRLYHARKLCPDLIQCPSRPARYAELSSAIMAALYELTPDVEVFSVDEAFLDVTDTQHLLGTPEQLGRKLKQLVFDVSGLLCSVGVSGDKTTAKFAAKLQKPDGLTLIHPDQARDRLAHVPVTELCGIAKGIGRFLAERGVHVCGDMQNLPVEILTRRFGPLGRRIWHMAQGEDPSPVAAIEQAPKSIGHGKVVPPNTLDARVLKTYLRHMSEKVAKRLRQHGLQAKRYYIGIKTEHGWLSNKLSLTQPGDNGKSIYQLCLHMMEQEWQGEGVFQVQVTALDPGAGPKQLDLFIEDDPRQLAGDLVRDQINQKFGHSTLLSADLLSKSSMPDVIAPAWRPGGVRRSV